MAVRRGVAHYNTLRGASPPSAELDSNSIKAEFARRLQTAMVAKGWNQSELARRATDSLPRPAPGQKRGHAIGRDLVSHYVRGAMLPGPANLEALAKALSVRPVDLMPAGVPQVGGGEPAPFEMKGMPDGRMYLRISRTVSQDTAMKIMAILADEDRAN